MSRTRLARIYRVWHFRSKYSKIVEEVEATTAAEAKKIIQEKYPDHTVSKVWLKEK